MCVVNLRLHVLAVIISFVVRPSDKPSQNVQKGKRKRMKPIKTKQDNRLDWFVPLCKPNKGQMLTWT